MKSLIIILSVLTLLRPSMLYAEVTMTDAQPVEYVQAGQQTAALPVAVVFLIAVGMNILRTQAVKSLSRAAAKKAAENFVKKQIKRVGHNARKRCFSVRGTGGARVLLAADKSTVLWAGDSHKAYERQISKFCN